MTASLLTENQKKEVLKRSALYKEGKSKVYTLEEARKILQNRNRANDKHSFE